MEDTYVVIQDKDGVKEITNFAIEGETVLFSGTLNECESFLYPNQDDTWPSRRWNIEHTEYIDLSGIAD